LGAHRRRRPAAPGQGCIAFRYINKYISKEQDSISPWLFEPEVPADFVRVSSIYILDYIEGLGYNPSGAAEAVMAVGCRGRGYSMWSVSVDGVRVYRAGKNDWAGAALAAENCAVFHEDVEEEIVADDLKSCYNCRFRRWTEASFACFHPHGGQAS
jgi:hypothetical protein